MSQTPSKLSKEQINQTAIMIVGMTALNMDLLMFADCDISEQDADAILSKVEQIAYVLMGDVDTSKLTSTSNIVNYTKATV